MQNESIDEKITVRLDRFAASTPSAEASILATDARREIMMLENMVASYELAFQRLMQVQMAMLGDRIAVEDGMIIDANQLGYPTIRDWDGLIEGFRESKP